jgi:hypothetical protein
MKKNKEIALIGFFAVSLVGIYILAAGLNNASILDFLSVIKSSIFWGLFHVMTGLYILIRFVKN